MCVCVCIHIFIFYQVWKAQNWITKDKLCFHEFVIVPTSYSKFFFLNFLYLLLFLIVILFPVVGIGRKRWYKNFFFFFSYACSLGKFLAQRSNPGHSCCTDNARSSTWCTTGELLICFGLRKNDSLSYDASLASV